MKIIVQFKTIHLRSLHTKLLKNKYDLTLYQLASILRGVLTVQSHHTKNGKIQNADCQVCPLHLCYVPARSVRSCLSLSLSLSLSLALTI